ncbi:MAG: hypothetical protein KBD06_05195 [Candidatus Pacebacteria bacterium]|nr:hypothetical protein [Candidatus Paceibacterota bacterium]
MTISRTTWILTFITIVITLVIVLMPNVTLAQTPKDASDALQNPSGCWYNFQFSRCIAVPVTLWASSAMLSMGGGLLRFAGSIFDFGVNHVIIDFKNTLVELDLVDIINSGWTFFRDLANILIIGIFVFIAISLILGLKEYGQKKMIARVLIIAVLMNFSLLFTKLVIDASNFAAYSIYSQTAKVPGTSGASPVFSIADKILEPLHITGVWDTSALALRVAQQTDGGAMKAFLFGLFGFFILAILALVVLYGAFLIIARAILFFILMLTAPIAYASYLSPHFEASKFGWTAWWKSLINNAMFAPLLMVFLSISILIMKTASEQVAGTDTFGALLNAPQAQVLGDGWRVLFVYILGTGMLFASFRLSSSLAGSISGIRAGQMAAGLPVIGAAMGLGFAGQRTLGWNNARRAQGMAKDVDKAKSTAMSTGLKSDWAAFEKLRKQKADLEKKSDRSYNFMNSSLGKAFAKSAGLKGVGETKGGFTSQMNQAAKNIDDKAKARSLNDDDKKKMRDEAEETIKNKYKDEVADKAKAKEAAEKELAIARESMETSKKEVAAAEAQTAQNKATREPEVRQAEKEVEVVTKEVESQKASLTGVYEKQIQELRKQRDSSTDQGEVARKDIEIERRKAQHSADMNKQTERIKTAESKLSTITADIERPHTEAQKRFEAAKKLHDQKETQVTKARKDASTLSSLITRETKELEASKLKTAQAGVKEGMKHLAESASAELGAGHTGEHIIQHSFDKYTKKSSSSSVLKDIQASLKAGGSSSTEGDAH